MPLAAGELDLVDLPLFAIGDCPGSVQPARAKISYGDEGSCKVLVGRRGQKRGVVPSIESPPRSIFFVAGKATIDDQSALLVKQPPASIQYEVTFAILLHLTFDLHAAAGIAFGDDFNQRVASGLICLR